MFQLETVKLSHPAEYKKIYEEIVNGENYKKMVGDIPPATQAEKDIVNHPPAVVTLAMDNVKEVAVGDTNNDAKAEEAEANQNKPEGTTATTTEKTGGRSHRKRIRNHRRTYKTHGGYKATIRRSKLSTNRHTPRSRTSHRPNILI